MRLSPIAPTIEDVTVHIIGRCPAKGCKNTRRNTVAGKKTRDRLGVRTAFILPSEDPLLSSGLRTLPSPDSRPSDAIFLNDRYSRALLNSFIRLGWICPQHNRFFKLIPVKGIVNIDRTCDHRCLNARRGDCECPCGGENHGASYAR